jgi:hypothetical protein
VGALVQHHLKDGAAAGGEQLAGHEQFGHPALAGAVGHPPLGPMVAAQPAALGVPFWLTITGSSDWTRYQITAQVPADADTMGFELTLAGPGQVRLRHVELTRAS